MNIFVIHSLLRMVHAALIPVWRWVFLSLKPLRRTHKWTSFYSVRFQALQDVRGHVHFVVLLLQIPIQNQEVQPLPKRGVFVCFYCWVKLAYNVDQQELLNCWVSVFLLQINTQRVAAPCVFHRVHAQPLNCGCFGSAPQTPYYWFDLAVFPAYSLLAFKNGVSCDMIHVYVDFACRLSKTWEQCLRVRCNLGHLSKMCMWEKSM